MSLTDAYYHQQTVGGNMQCSAHSYNIVRHWCSVTEKFPKLRQLEVIQGKLFVCPSSTAEALIVPRISFHIFGEQLVFTSCRNADSVMY